MRKLRRSGRVNKHNQPYSWFECRCGRIVEKLENSVQSGNTRSCGCLGVKHNYSYDDRYNTWIGIIHRCTNSDNSSYKDYGARGITVCSRWLTIENFMTDVGPRPSKRHSLDRIDVNGNYCPENCRWVLPEVQSNNSRRNRRVKWNGKLLTLSQWSRFTGIDAETISYRIKSGWTLNDTFGKPVRKSNGRI
jgi:hypothetical protein